MNIHSVGPGNQEKQNSKFKVALNSLRIILSNFVLMIIMKVNL